VASLGTVTDFVKDPSAADVPEPICTGADVKVTVTVTPPAKDPGVQVTTVVVPAGPMVTESEHPGALGGYCWAWAIVPVPRTAASMNAPATAICRIMCMDAAFSREAGCPTPRDN
jgi:hypothetical protein